MIFLLMIRTFNTQLTIDSQVWDGPREASEPRSCYDLDSEESPIESLELGSVAGVVWLGS